MNNENKGRLFVDFVLRIARPITTFKLCYSALFSILSASQKALINTIAAFRSQLISIFARVKCNCHTFPAIRIGTAHFSYTRSTSSVRSTREKIQIYFYQSVGFFPFFGLVTCWITDAEKRKPKGRRNFVNVVRAIVSFLRVVVEFRWSFSPKLSLVAAKKKNSRDVDKRQRILFSRQNNHLDFLINSHACAT